MNGTEEDMVRAQHRFVNRRAQWVRRRRSVTVLAAAVTAVALGSAVLSQNLNDPSVETAGPAPGDAATEQTRTTGENGWVAFAARPPGDFSQQSDIYLVKEGLPAHRLFELDGDQADQLCPTFSPDGARLVAGQAIGTDDSGWEDAALVITDMTADGEPFDTTTLALDGVTEEPCAIWSADSRWLALHAGTPDTQRESPLAVSEVWVIDTHTNDIRRLTGLGATDIAWAPTAPELFIASNGITVYSTTTGNTRPVDNTSGVVAFAFSPDGESLVVEHDSNGDRDGPSDLLLMGANGSDQRTLAANYEVFHGIGPVWSPDGNRVAFQRLCDTWVDESGKDQICREEHDVVVITVSDHELGSFGTTTVIAPPKTTQHGVPQVWAPYRVSWSPDSTALLYVAWSSPDSGRLGILAVPVDSAEPPVILEDVLNVAGDGSEWNWAQQRN